MDYGQSAAGNAALPQVGLRTTLDRTQTSLGEALGVLCNIEDRIHGSVPRGVSAVSSEPQQHPGVRVVAEQTATEAELLVKRLYALLEAI